MPKNSWRNNNYTQDMEERAKEMQKRKQEIIKLPKIVQDIHAFEIQEYWKQL